MGWVQNGKTAQDYAKDKYECQVRANQMYPPIVVQGPQKMSQQCQQSGCSTELSTEGAIDTNAGPRDMENQHCLEMRGWAWQWNGSRPAYN